MAAELAAAEIAGVTPRTVKTGTALIAAGGFADRDLSELLGALASRATADGSRKAARAFLRASLVDPTENAVAQAMWLARSEGFEELALWEPISRKTHGSFEALSYWAYNHGAWDIAYDEAGRWVDDEPFSGRAAIHAAVLAGVALDRPDDATRLLRTALRVGPNDFSVRANLV